MPSQPTTLPPRTDAVQEISAPQPDHASRRRRALELVRAENPAIRALLISDPKDIRYLTGVHEGLFWLVLHDGPAFGLTRHMMVHEVRAAAVDCEILLPTRSYTPFADYDNFLSSELMRRGLDHVAVCPAKISAAAYLKVAGSALAMGFRLEAAPDLVSRLRAVKDPGELALIRRCTSIAERAFSEMFAAGAAAWIGRSERDIASELEYRMCGLGADRQGFPDTGIIVAVNHHSASGHHPTGRRRIARGDLVLVDWGAELDGYRSDLTRTLFVGGVPNFALDAYPVVEAALQRSAAALRAGAKTGEIDRLARETVIDAGYEEFFYGLGHGLGLDIHEAPWLRVHGDDLLAEHMVTTIEPGIYLPGTGGIRIENMYQVTTEGHERIGSLPTRLDDMVLE